MLPMIGPVRAHELYRPTTSRETNEISREGHDGGGASKYRRRGRRVIADEKEEDTDTARYKGETGETKADTN
jgi:hypothetical protein